MNIKQNKSHLVLQVFTTIGAKKCEQNMAYAMKQRQIQQNHCKSGKESIPYQMIDCWNFFGMVKHDSATPNFRVT